MWSRAHVREKAGRGIVTCAGFSIVERCPALGITPRQRCCLRCDATSRVEAACPPPRQRRELVPRSRGVRLPEQAGGPSRKSEPALSTRHDETQRLRNDDKQASP